MSFKEIDVRAQLLNRSKMEGFSSTGCIKKWLVTGFYR